MAHGKTLTLRELEAHHPPIQRPQVDDKGKPLPGVPASQRARRPRKFRSPRDRNEFLFHRAIHRRF